MSDPVVVPSRPDPPPQRDWRTRGRGRETVEVPEGRWPLVQPEALLARLRELGALVCLLLASCESGLTATAWA